MEQTLDSKLKQRRLRLFLRNLKLCLADASETIERFDKEMDDKHEE